MRANGASGRRFTRSTAVLAVACVAGGLLAAGCSTSVSSLAAPTPTLASTPVTPSSSPTASPSASPSAKSAAGCKVGVTLNYADTNYELWEAPAINLALAPEGGTYVSDAKSSSDEQASDIDAFVAAGMDVIMIKPVTEMPQYLGGVPAAVKRATDAGIPVISDEGFLDSPNVLHIGFDWIEVGRLEARAMLAARPKGNYVIVKGPPDDYYADMVGRGIAEVLQPALDSGAIKIVGELSTNDWDERPVKPAMDAILKKNHNRIDAVVVEGDLFAGYVAASLKEAGLEGKVALSGDYSFPWRLQAVARGVQTVDVWRDYTRLGRTVGETASALCRDRDIAHVSGTTQITLSNGHQIPSILHTPQAITRDNLSVVLDAGWITKDELCKDVDPAKAPPACQ